MKITTGLLFAGIGGFCRAFQQNGAAVLWANDKDRFAAETFRLNFPNVRYGLCKMIKYARWKKCGFVHYGYSTPTPDWQAIKTIGATYEELQS